MAVEGGEKLQGLTCRHWRAGQDWFSLSLSLSLFQSLGPSGFSHPHLFLNSPLLIDLSFAY
jgi:hypothetical protein